MRKADIVDKLRRSRSSTTTSTKGPNRSDSAKSGKAKPRNGGATIRKGGDGGQNGEAVAYATFGSEFLQNADEGMLKALFDGRSSIHAAIQKEVENKVRFNTYPKETQELLKLFDQQFRDVSKVLERYDEADIRNASIDEINREFQDLVRSAKPLDTGSEPAKKPWNPNFGGDDGIGQLVIAMAQCFFVVFAINDGFIPRLIFFSPVDNILRISTAVGILTPGMALLHCAAVTAGCIGVLGKQIPGMKSIVRASIVAATDNDDYAEDIVNKMEEMKWRDPIKYFMDKKFIGFSNWKSHFRKLTVDKGYNWFGPRHVFSPNRNRVHPQ